MLQLVDDPGADILSIAGIGLEHTEVFPDPEEMRAVREAIPFAARTQQTRGAYSYKGHTDAVIRLNPDRVKETMNMLWQENLNYVSSVQQYLTETPGVEGEILIYGHLNPVGVDPHNRITFASDDESYLLQAIDYVHHQRDQLYRRLNELCLETDSTFIGGEKGAGSEYEMYPAFGGVNEAPTTLMNKFNQQIGAIRRAPKFFNWRALAPYN